MVWRGGGSSLEPEIALALDLFNLGRELRTSGVEGLGLIIVLRI